MSIIASVMGVVVTLVTIFVSVKWFSQSTEQYSYYQDSDGNDVVQSPSNNEKEM